MGWACGGSSFACDQAADCSDGGSVGTCEPTGWCSFPDTTCESGSRYGELAGDGLAGQCVDPIAGTGSSGSDGTGDVTLTSATGSLTDATSDPTTTTTATATASTTDDSSGETSTAGCGNQVLEGAEQCDDGNLTPGDGCSPDCEISGTILWERTIDGDDGSWGHALDLFADGELAVGFAVDIAGTAFPGIWRVDQDGTIVWTWAFPDATWQTAFTWGVDVGAVEDGEAIAVGVTGASGQPVLAGIAVLDELGSTAFALTEPGLYVYGSALEPDGSALVVGHYAGQPGILVEVTPEGEFGEVQIGEPFVPIDGFAYDLARDGDVLFFAGQHGPVDAQAAFIGATAGVVVVRHDFAPSEYNEGLAVALDSRSTRRWICGYAGEQGGWVAAVAPEGVVLDPTVVTEVFPANLHGIAVDPSGAVVVVGWDSAGGTADRYVVKVAPDGAKVWSTSFPTAGGDDDLRDVAIGAAGELFVVGSQVGDDGLSTGWVARLVP